MIKITLPIRVRSEANISEPWIDRWSRKKAQQREVCMLWKHEVGRKHIPIPCLLTFTRYGAKALDPDAVSGSFKFVQDEVCRLIGVDDGNTEKISFRYNQVALRKREYYITIEVEAIGAI